MLALMQVSNQDAMAVVNDLERRVKCGKEKNRFKSQMPVPQYFLCMASTSRLVSSVLQVPVE